MIKQTVKDIMHVGTIFSASTVASDVVLAKLLLLSQLNVMTEVAVLPLSVTKKRICTVVIFTNGE